MKIGFHQTKEHNTWAEVKPSLKLLYGLGIICSSLVVPNFYFGYVIFFMVGLTLKILAGIPCRAYLRCYRVPLIFILISLVTIVFEVGVIPQQDSLVWAWGDTRGLFITKEGLGHAIELSGKILGTLSGLFSIALTSTLVDILQVLKKLRLPTIFLTMMELVYRFSMSIYANFSNIIIAQEQRLGYFSLRRGIPALATGLGRIFSNLLFTSRRTATALDLRLFQGRLNTLPKTYLNQPETERQIAVATVLVIAFAVGFSFA